MSTPTEGYDDQPPPELTASTVQGEPPQPLHPSKFLPTYDRPQQTCDFTPNGTTEDKEILPQIPGYEILGELGRGGMGVVYKARQEKVNRLVALKMILRSGFASPDARLRFLWEGEVLGRLQHPNIVQIYDVGTHEGHPFFALEFVEGGNLHDFTKKQPIPPRAAAALVETLARAMHYAHCNGVIHRDLKPANVLLTSDGQAKITDFGIAKQVERDTEFTATGALIGTPQYMAPEQAERKAKHATPATDVYALGAILYELLAGRPPFSGETVWEVLRQITDTEPPSLHALQTGLPRDLVTICHKCLQKEPTRRYASAESLAEDLRRCQEDRPIGARPVSRLERTWRWCRRNPAMATLTTLTLVLLLAGSITSTLLGFWAIRERDQATARTAEVLTMNEFLVKDLIGQAAPGVAQNRQLTFVEALNRAAQRIDSRFVGKPDLEASVRAELAAAFVELGDYVLAEPHLRRAVDVFRTTRGDSSPYTLRTKGTLLACLGRSRDPQKQKEIRQVNKQVQDDMRRELGPEHRSTLILRRNEAIDLLHAGRFAEGEQALKEIFATQQRLLGPDDLDTLSTLEALAVGYFNVDQVDKARTYGRKCYDGRLRVLGPDHPDTLSALKYALETLPLTTQQKIDNLRRIVEVIHKTYGPDHEETQVAWDTQGGHLLHYARALGRMGELVEAEKAYRELLASYERTKVDPQDGNLAQTRLHLAEALCLQEKWPEAISFYEQYIQWHRQQRALESGQFQIARNNLALALLQMNRLSEAEAQLRDLLKDYRKAAKDDQIASWQSRLGEALTLQGRLKEAEPFLRETLQACERLNRPHPLTSQTLSVLGACLTAQGQYAEAEPLLLQAFQGLDKQAGFLMVKRRQQTIERLVTLYVQWGKPEQAATWRAKLPTPPAKK